MDGRAALLIFVRTCAQQKLGNSRSECSKEATCVHDTTIPARAAAMGRLHGVHHIGAHDVWPPIMLLHVKES